MRVLFVVILTIFLASCSQTDNNSNDSSKIRKTEPIKDSLPDHELTTAFLSVHFPSAFESDSSTSEFGKTINYYTDSDSIKMALSITYNDLIQPSQSDSTLQLTHQKIKQRMGNQYQIAKWDMDHAPQTQQPQAKLEGKTSQNNCILYAYGLDKGKMWQLEIWTDSAHISVGRNLMRSLQILK